MDQDESANEMDPALLSDERDESEFKFHQVQSPLWHERIDTSRDGCQWEITPIPRTKTVLFLEAE